ncbi:MAG: hypothetical protein H9W81_13895 [Enterococcus sp.]|nr:hypothetical protein [Enterococcus sp.]
MHNVKVIPSVKYRSLKKKVSQQKNWVGKMFSTIRNIPLSLKQKNLQRSVKYTQHLAWEQRRKIDVWQSEIAQRRTVRGEKNRTIDVTTMELDTRVLNAMNELRRLDNIIADKTHLAEKIMSQKKHRVI